MSAPAYEPGDVVACIWTVPGGTRSAYGVVERVNARSYRVCLNPDTGEGRRFARSVNQDGWTLNNRIVGKVGTVAS